MHTVALLASAWYDVFVVRANSPENDRKKYVTRKSNRVTKFRRIWDDVRKRAPRLQEFISLA
jgi:hypothetical protein